MAESQTRAKKGVAMRTSGEPASAELLLEIGTEELPYYFIQPALRALADSAERLLKEHRLLHGTMRTFGTPRRLVLVVESLSGRQASTVREAMGPSRAVAFDAAGQPTKAAVGFAGSQGVAVGDLEIRQIRKGEYVFAVKREPGRQSPAVLAELLPALISGLSFPKSMRWNASGMRFARPIRWLLALYGGKVVQFQVGGISAGNRTWGHRFLPSSGTKARRGLQVANFKSYAQALERHSVVSDQDRRRTMILSQLAALAHSARGHLHRDEDLLEQAVYTVEYPHAILGEFNPQYLSLPKDILMTAMKEHQGYFSLMRPDGSLLPKFISVTNMKLANMRLIREGNERVLAARLADAKFFFDEDRKVKLADRVKKLAQVTFHQKLGTLHQKQERVIKLVGLLAKQLSVTDETSAACRRAAQLCKADLLTGIVGEFPTLQGIMGGEYSRHDGEPEAVSLAISEQYLPPSMEGELPKTLAGKILSLADRLDTIAAFFHVGIVPTGSEDPFALRRHATAIVRIIIEGNLRLNLGKAVDHASNIVNDDGFKAVTLHEKVAKPLDFIAERFRYYARTVHGLRDDVIETLLKRSDEGIYDLIDLLSRMKALQAITTRPEFDPLMIGFKRAHRLVEKESWAREDIEGALFQHASEKELHRALHEARQRVPAAIARGDYAKALDALVQLKPAIDEFFVGVMVNADDPALRANRLSLLYAVDRLFLSYADFSQIVVAGD
ncbi:MAG: glycine--tRNA ligase subunit beta [Nitrospirae bacterium]|nr:glycine--tRNA ligase subunit beta [Nitrospirota bacterium]